MKTILLLSFLLSGATALHGQTAPAGDDLPEPAKAEQEVYSVHQSLAQAYLRNADQRNIDVFYGENFRLGQRKDAPASRQQMDATMKMLVREGLIAEHYPLQGELQMAAENPVAVVVSGTWKAPANAPAGKPVPYAFTYSRQAGVWKLTEARFLPGGQPLASRNR